MVDELQVLQGNDDLSRLLAHYAVVGAVEREAWQDRVMELEGVDRQGLAKLHGMLIAFGWLEQNTGVVPVPQPGAVRQCYRITAAGLRALKMTDLKDETTPSAVPPPNKIRRGKMLRLAGPTCPEGPCRPPPAFAGGHGPAGSCDLRQEKSA
jgi:hypothetical protein